MAQNITVQGASYTGVPAVDLPITGGGTARFMDTSDATASASDIASGMTAYVNGVLLTGTASGSGLEYETGTYSPSSDASHPTISFSNSHSDPPIFAVIADMTGTVNSSSNSAVLCSVFNYYRAFGTGIYYSSSSIRYGAVQNIYRGSSSSSLSSATTHITYPDTNSGSSSNSYMRYWITESAFKPYSGSSSRYFRSGRTYQWIAIWE